MVDLNFVDRIMESHSLTLMALARLSGIPYRTLQAWRLGDRQPPAWLPPMVELWIEVRMACNAEDE